MEIKNINVNDLIPYINNPRKNDHAVDFVANSIKEFGFKVPIVIDSKNEIIAGHTRLKAALKLGLKEVPCIIADDLTPEQIKAFRLADNKTGEFADWDIELLMAEMEELSDLEFDMEPFGFEKQVDEVVEDEFDVDRAIEAINDPVSKVGDIYKLGNHRLMCGDSTSEDDVKVLIDSNPIFLINNDPPYGINAVSKSGVLSKTYKTDIIGDNNNNIAIKSFELCQRLFKTSNQVWWGANYYSECLPSSECWIVWDKNNGESDQIDCELAYANFRSVVRKFTLSSEKKNRVHPNQKPVKLFEWIINKFDKERSFKTVLDLFGGSGFTLIGAEQMEITSYTMELEPIFVDVIINRWELFTGQKAELI